MDFDKNQPVKTNQTMSATEWAASKKQSPLDSSPNKPINISQIGQKGTFDYEAFKRDYPSVFQQIKAERTAAFVTFQQFPNYQQLLEGSIIAHSESWWKKNESK